MICLVNKIIEPWMFQKYAKYVIHYYECTILVHLITIIEACVSFQSDEDAFFIAAPLLKQPMAIIVSMA